jgi:hypothetical protein
VIISLFKCKKLHFEIIAVSGYRTLIVLSKSRIADLKNFISIEACYLTMYMHVMIILPSEL